MKKLMSVLLAATLGLTSVASFAAGTATTPAPAAKPAVTAPAAKATHKKATHKKATHKKHHKTKAAAKTEAKK